MNITRFKYCLLVFFLALAAPLALRAQESAPKAIPDEDFYLMPAFCDGMVYLRGQAPAQGKMNICAVDNTLRFIDNNGVELEAANAEQIVRVQLDTVWFIRNRGVFYRMYPASYDMGVALRRDVRIIRDAKEGAYGGSSQTSSIREYSSLYTESGVYNLNSNKTYPYDVKETLYLYKGEGVYPLSKNNLKKLFPDKKADIEAWFKAGNSLPKTVAEAQALLSSWAQ